MQDSLSLEREQSIGLMQNIDPYQIPAGPELDAILHFEILGNPVESIPLCYSTETADADKLREFIQAKYGHPFVCGRTRMREKKWFARYEIDPGNPTEVLASTYPLAICPLALLRAQRR